MKPASLTQNSRSAKNRRFPVIDCNYHALRFTEFSGRCTQRRTSSFTNISRDYFAGEARFNFVIESVVLALITSAAIPAMIDCVRALGEFFRAVGIY